MGANAIPIRCFRTDRILFYLTGEMDITTMRRRSRLLVGLIFASATSVRPDERFALALEECIRNHAKRLAQTFPQWGNKCVPATT